MFKCDCVDVDVCVRFCLSVCRLSINRVNVREFVYRPVCEYVCVCLSVGRGGEQWTCCTVSMYQIGSKSAFHFVKQTSTRHTEKGV